MSFCSWGGGVSVWEVVSVQEGLSLGCLCQRDPPYGKEWVVRILLKCILVTIIITSTDNLNDLTGTELEKKEIPRLQWNCLLPTMITGKRTRSF